jgi:hypothetical protein
MKKVIKKAVAPKRMVAAPQQAPMQQAPMMKKGGSIKKKC